ncbi:hypothetical protein [Companilactobacillus sp. HBUAS59699]|uniref:hypothetical protein n=1 Tax=Companilactobacillus sp. HBUAS59699 TaxID=3109358 RepID=UPI002FF1B92D
MNYILKFIVDISLTQFQDACIEYGKQQALCEFQKDYPTGRLLKSANEMNQIKKSLITAMTGD